MLNRCTSHLSAHKFRKQNSQKAKPSEPQSKKKERDGECERGRETARERDRGWLKKREGRERERERETENWLDNCLWRNLSAFKCTPLSHTIPFLPVSLLQSIYEMRSHDTAIGFIYNPCAKQQAVPCTIPAVSIPKLISPFLLHSPTLFSNISILSFIINKCCNACTNCCKQLQTFVVF